MARDETQGQAGDAAPSKPAEGTPSGTADEALSELEADSPSPTGELLTAIETKPNRAVWTVGTLVYTTSGLVLLFCWLLWGDFALNLRERSVGTLVEKFLLKNGASNMLKQLLTATLPTMIGLILSPAISYMSDRTRSRWGRRIPFLIIPTPIAGVAMIGIAFSPQMGQWLYTATGHAPPAGVTMYEAASTYTLWIFTVLWTLFEVAVITSAAVLGGLINDVVPRPVLGRFHGLFRAVSLYDGILFNSLLLSHAEQHFSLMFALIGILFGGGFLLMCLKVREGEYPPPPPEPQHLSHAGGVLGWFVSFLSRFFRAAMGYLHECFTQPYYLLCFAMFTLSGLTFRPINDFSYRYAMQLRMEDSDYGFINSSSYVVSLILAFPLGMLVDRFHPIRMALLALALYTLTLLYGALFATDAWTFGIALIAHVILSGTFFTCSASLGQQLLPRSKFTQYASAGGIVGSLAALIYAPIIGKLIDLTVQHTAGPDGANRNLYDYHMTFWGGLGFSIITIIVMLVVYRRFMHYGGPKGYLAPGDTEFGAARHEPPAHMLQILTLYFLGAAVGVTAGYILSYFVLTALISHNVLKVVGLQLDTLHQLIMTNKDVRNITTFCIATGVIPFVILGGWAGTAIARRRKAAVS